MMEQLTASPFFGIVLCIIAYEIGVFINRKFPSPYSNAMYIAVFLIIIVLLFFQIPLENFDKGGDVISLFLSPVTAILAVSIYSRLDVLKKNFLPLLAGCVAGAISSLASILILCHVFGLEQELTASIMPKSVTTAIAIEISRQHGGVVAITVAAVMITGIVGVVGAPLFIKLLRVKDPVAQGVAIGTSCHAIGTAKALEIGEVQGAMSGVAIGVCGIATVLLSLLISG